MRKYQEYRDDARGMTTTLCLLLAVAVTGTIVVSAMATAGVTVAVAYGYMSAMTRFEVSAGHWQNLFSQRLLQVGVLTTLLVVGTAVYRSVQLKEGGGRWLARSLGGTRVHADATDPSHVKLIFNTTM